VKLVMQQWIGILPAAGLATRLGSPGLPKELLPVVFDELEGGLRPVPVIEHTLQSMAEAGVERAYVVIAAHKLELVRVLGAGQALPVAFVCQPDPVGLTDAVLCALRWCEDQTVCLALPDTWFEPTNALAALRPVLTGADLVLGVFPTEHPHELGPVRFDGQRVVEVLDKPVSTDLRNTWGIAAWTPRFSTLLREADPGPIGYAFQQAVEAGLRVRAVWFPRGRFTDVGTARSLRDLVVGWPVE
jgi:glucose-1-phosphate thymidylyltransferase